MKILIDMNLSPNCVKVLTEAGIEAVHWAQVGPANTPDPAIMVYAATHGFTVLTNDLDFGVALATANKKGQASCRYVETISGLNQLGIKCS